jgi:hypothetical protein
MTVMPPSAAAQNLWELIHFLQECREITLPEGSFRIVGKDSAELAEILAGSDKSQVLEAVRSVLGSSLTQAELDLIANRKGQLDIFHRLLNDPAYFEDCRDKRRAAKEDAKPDLVALEQERRHMAAPKRNDQRQGAG